MSAETIAEAMTTGRLSLTVLDDGSGVLLDQEKEALLSLNTTGLAIVSAIADGCREEQDLAERLSQQFDIDPEKAKADVHHFLTQLTKVL